VTEAPRKNKDWIGTECEFDAFLEQYESPQFAAAVHAVSGGDAEEVSASLDRYLTEMRHGFAFVAEHLPRRRQRILEVGAGLGLISIYLQSKGHDVTALEPGAPSFDIFEATKSVIWDKKRAVLPRLLERGAETLDTEVDGTFDFIFSINVIEHIAALEDAIAAMIGVLAPEGLCVNTCPNYTFPYEPHYSIPLIPFAPRLSRRVFANKIEAEPDVWETLNFVTSAKVRRMARDNGAVVTFQPGTLYDAVSRLGTDEAFARRHRSGIVMAIYRALSATGLLGLLKFAPARLVTPMVFTFRHR
jgi:SAM-dependent methyltransferase